MADFKTQIKDTQTGDGAQAGPASPSTSIMSAP